MLTIVDDFIKILTKSTSAGILYSGSAKIKSTVVIKEPTNILIVLKSKFGTIENLRTTKVFTDNILFRSIFTIKLEPGLYT